MDRARSIVLFFSGFFLFCFSSQVVWSQDIVSAWGRNDFGQLGDGGTFTTTNTPVPVSGVVDVTAIAGGGLYSLALKGDGTIWAWGLNNYGQLGNTTVTRTNTPLQVIGLTNMTAIAGGFDHGLALQSNGTVWAWGRNDFGQLADGTNNPISGPVPVSGINGIITAIAGGGLHSLALQSNGTVWAWGYNGLGQLGNSTNTSSNTPVQVSGLTGVIAIAGGYFHSLALKSDGTVWAWGWNFYGQLGNGFSDTNTPVPVSGISGGITAIAGGGSHSLALSGNGTVWAWGSNERGQLGNAFFGGNTPVPVSGLTGVSVIRGGEFHSLALKSEGTVWAWGSNDRGQLGDGTYTSTNTPVPVSGLTGQARIASGEHHSLALALSQAQVTPAQAINNLIVQVNNWSLGVLRPGQTRSLTAKLEEALEYLQTGNEADAISALQAFENNVRGLVSGRRVTATAAAPLLSAADNIIAMLIAML